MLKKINGCVDCGLPCSGYCEYRDNTYVYYCDVCDGEIVDDVIEFGELHLCENCAPNSYAY